MEQRKRDSVFLCYELLFSFLQRVELLFHAFQALFLHFGTGEASLLWNFHK
ncbi:hypothetical protein [Capnocytophaga sputigena]|uniref:hypothetical protein n=1 Tax=Capnocytophaga sputigena TaxID=1019 RepID=UPI0013FE4DEC|nr:hypothetical protein [Capnocytophaga sputigena]